MLLFMYSRKDSLYLSPMCVSACVHDHEFKCNKFIRCKNEKIKSTIRDHEIR